MQNVFKSLARETTKSTACKIPFYWLGCGLGGSINEGENRAIRSSKPLITTPVTAGMSMCTLSSCCNPRSGKNTGLPEDLGSMEGRLYIHDAEQIIGVEDARIAKICGNEHASKR